MPVKGPDSASSPSDALDSLTRRQRQVLELLAAGCSLDEVADRLHLSVPTVKSHTRVIYRRLGVRNREAAVRVLNPASPRSHLRRGPIGPIAKGEDVVRHGRGAPASPIEGLDATQAAQTAVGSAREALEKALRELDALDVPAETGAHGEAADHLAAVEAAIARSTSPSTERLEAVSAFAETLHELLPEDVEIDVATARRAAILAATEQVWDNELGTLVDSSDVSALLSVSRQRVNELTRQQRLIALRSAAGRLLYPAFQFIDGRPATALVQAFYSVASGAASEWTAAAWCVGPDPALDGLSPVAWIKDGRGSDRLLEVAGHDRARLVR